MTIYGSVLPRLGSAAVLLSLSAAAATPAAAASPVTGGAPYRGPATTAAYVPLATGGATQPAPQHVGSISDAVRRDFDIPPFYTRGVMIRGMPIIGSDKVSDWAFLECAYVLDHMLANSPPSVIDDLNRAKVKVGILSVVEYTMDIPENQVPENANPREAAFQDQRSRGLGGIPLATCGEENLLNLHGDPYYDEDITIHEFSHTVASAIRLADPAWYERLVAAYNHAMATGLFAHSYSATNEQEYWAEGAQAYFDCAAPTKDPTVHSGIWTRSQLKAYDPELAGLLAGVYGDGPWRYVRADDMPLIADGFERRRTPAEMAHLAGLDRDRMPTFDLQLSPRIQAWAAANRRAAATGKTGTR